MDDVHGAHGSAGVVEHPLVVVGVVGEEVRVRVLLDHVLEERLDDERRVLRLALDGGGRERRVNALVQLDRVEDVEPTVLFVSLETHTKLCSSRPIRCAA